MLKATGLVVYATADNWWLEGDGLNWHRMLEVYVPGFNSDWGRRDIQDFFFGNLRVDDLCLEARYQAWFEAWKGPKVKR